MTPQRWHLCVLLTLAVAMATASKVRPRGKKFRGAVYEHQVLQPVTENVTRAEAISQMQRNLDVYRRHAARARTMGADIIVFPEDGIYGITFTRAGILPFLESVPDPRKVTWSPCHDPGRFPHTEVQHALSCMARENFIYVVANMGDVQACDVITDPRCPSDGRYQYNTAVAFGPTGQLLARYHKVHLFYESQFDRAEPEFIYFDTPFGRFGLFVCFDVLFHDPMLTLYDHFNITNVAFPTAWSDAMPLLSAVGFHSSIARGLGVNFLAANIHLPLLKFHGSGIYTPTSIANYYYDRDLLSGPKLLIADLKILYKRRRNRNRFTKYRSILRPKTNDENTFSTQKQELDSFNIVHNLKTKQDRLHTYNRHFEVQFRSELFHDNFTFKNLAAQAGFIEVCDNGVCCSLNYSKNRNGINNDELFAFGVFNGLHTYQGSYYWQICALVKCANDLELSSCGSPTYESKTSFDKLHIHGHFDRGSVYPQITLASKDNNLKFLNETQFIFRKNRAILSIGTNLDEPLLVAALISRDYSKDPNISFPLKSLTKYGDRKFLNTSKHNQLVDTVELNNVDFLKLTMKLICACFSFGIVLAVLSKYFLF